MESAAITGMTQSKVSQVRGYKLLTVSLERLMQALLSLNQHVEIVVLRRNVLIMLASA
jgi:predicted XRE-type DNA-binding protein